MAADLGPLAGREDFVLVLRDVSSHRWSKARRLIGTMSLGLLAPEGAPSVACAIELLESTLVQAGFSIARERPALTPACTIADSTSSSVAAGTSDVVLLVRGSEAKLHRLAYREQLDSWIQAKSRGEFTHVALLHAAFTPARRVALLYAPLLDLVPQLQKTALRPDLLALHAAFPRHDRDFSSALLLHLARQPLLQAQMLHALRNEYGEKVAFYFAFRSFHQRWLVLPAVLGTLLWLSRFLSEMGSAHLAPIYGLSISVWGSLFLDRWRVQQRELACLWAVDDLREAEVVQPDFVGERIVSPLTGDATLHYPRWKRTLKRCVTVPVLGAQLLLLTGIIALLYAAWLWVYESEHHPATKTGLIILISAVWGLLIELLNWKVFLRLASALNRWENYKTTIEYEKQLVAKLFAFFVIDGFLWYLCAFFI